MILPQLIELKSNDPCHARIYELHCHLNLDNCIDHWYQNVKDNKDILPISKIDFSEFDIIKI